MEPAVNDVGLRPSVPFTLEPREREDAHVSVTLPEPARRAIEKDAEFADEGHLSVVRPPPQPRVVIERIDVEIIAPEPPRGSQGGGESTVAPPTAASVSRIGPLRSGRLTQSRFAVGR
jgi:hypothetical protein